MMHEIIIFLATMAGFYLIGCIAAALWELL